MGPLTLRLIAVDDGIVGSFDGVAGSTFDGCETILNTGDLSGQIALIQRGGCEFETKIRNAEDAGAKAVVVFSDQGEPILMSGDARLRGHSGPDDRPGRRATAPGTAGGPRIPWK